MRLRKFLTEEPPNYSSREAAKRKAEELTKKDGKKRHARKIKDLGWVVTEGYFKRIRTGLMTYPDEDIVVGIDIPKEDKK